MVLNRSWQFFMCTFVFLFNCWATEDVLHLMFFPFPQPRSSILASSPFVFLFVLNVLWLDLSKRDHLRGPNHLNKKKCSSMYNKFVICVFTNHHLATENWFNTLNVELMNFETYWENIAGKLKRAVASALFWHLMCLWQSVRQLLRLWVRVQIATHSYIQKFWIWHILSYIYHNRFFWGWWVKRTLSAPACVSSLPEEKTNEQDRICGCLLWNWKHFKS